MIHAWGCRHRVKGMCSKGLMLMYVCGYAQQTNEQTNQSINQPTNTTDVDLSVLEGVLDSMTFDKLTSMPEMQRFIDQDPYIAEKLRMGK